MMSPCLEIDIETRIIQLCAVTLIDVCTQLVGEMPGSSPEITPWHPESDPVI